MSTVVSRSGVDGHTRRHNHYVFIFYNDILQQVGKIADSVKQLESKSKEESIDEAVADCTRMLIDLNMRIREHRDTVEDEKVLSMHVPGETEMKPEYYEGTDEAYVLDLGECKSWLNGVEPGYSILPAYIGIKKVGNVIRFTDIRRTYQLCCTELAEPLEVKRQATYFNTLEHTCELALLTPWMKHWNKVRHGCFNCYLNNMEDGQTAILHANLHLRIVDFFRSIEIRQIDILDDDPLHTQY